MIYKYSYGDDDYVIFNDELETVEAVGEYSEENLRDAKGTGFSTYNSIVQWFKKHTDVHYCKECGEWLQNEEDELCEVCRNETATNDMEQFGEEWHTRIAGFPRYLP